MEKESPERQARIALAAAHRLTVLENLHEGLWNHFSLKHPDQPEQILLTPGHIHFSEVRASNLVLMGPEGEIVRGDLEPNVAAWAIHYPIQRARPDLTCLMHVHTPHALALGMRLDLHFNDRASQTAAHFYDAVATYDAYEGSLEEEEGCRMAEALSDKRVLLMRNHGVLVGGDTVAQCWHALYLFERACMAQLLAGGGENTLSLIPEREAKEVAVYGLDPIWELRYTNWCRLLEAQHADYRD